MKVKALLDFNYSKYGKIKKLESFNKVEEGKIFKNDIFEVTKEEAKYLLGENPSKLVAVEVIEEEKDEMKKIEKSVIDEIIKPIKKRKKRD